MEIVPTTLVNRGLAALGLGEHERAASFEEALLMSHKVGQKPQVLESVERMASLAGALKNDTLAARLWGAAEAAREVIGIALPPDERALYEPYLAAVRSRLGDAACEEALTKGPALSLEEVTEHVLSDKMEPSTLTEAHSVSEREASKARQPPGLTRREKEIASLVARRLTSRLIASELVLFVRTSRAW